jgi:hypothetical protein
MWGCGGAQCGNGAGRAAEGLGTAKEVARHDMPHTSMKPSPAMLGIEMSRSAMPARSAEPDAMDVICARAAVNESAYSLDNSKQVDDRNSKARGR